MPPRPSNPSIRYWPKVDPIATGLLIETNHLVSSPWIPLRLFDLGRVSIARGGNRGQKAISATHRCGGSTPGSAFKLFPCSVLALSVNLPSVDLAERLWYCPAIDSDRILQNKIDREMTP